MVLRGELKTLPLYTFPEKGGPNFTDGETEA